MTERPDQDEIAATREGLLRGRRIGGIVEFRGVPFAAPPVGARRFLPPAPAARWAGIRDALADGPVPPQPAARPGEPDNLDEDCLYLTIWTPGADDRRRPVLVWIYGGGFIAGSGSAPLYDGRLLAGDDIVVVTLNYRLGALGYLSLPGVSPGNLGLLDQIAALRWVRDNIAAFGGDPDDMTLAGQSGGAQSAALAISSAPGRGIVRRLILQSPAFATGLATPPEAVATGHAFVRELGLDPDAEGLDETLRAMPVADILAAQARVTAAMWRGDRGQVRRAFVPAALAPLETANGISGAIANAIVEDDIAVLIGTARDDAAQFYRADPATWAMDEDLFLHRLGTMLPGSPEAHLRTIRERRPGRSLAECFVDLVTDHQLRLSALSLADDVSARGGTVYFYRFDWHAPGALHGASHCVEIPVIFGTFEAWRDMPFLAGLDETEAATLSAAIRSRWLRFVRTGDPNAPRLDGWPLFEPDSREVMQLSLDPRHAPAEPPCYDVPA